MGFHMYLEYFCENDRIYLLVKSSIAILFPSFGKKKYMQMDGNGFTVIPSIDGYYSNLSFVSFYIVRKYARKWDNKMQMVSLIGTIPVLRAVETRSIHQMTSFVPIQHSDDCCTTQHGIKLQITLTNNSNRCHSYCCSFRRSFSNKLSLNIFSFV